MVYDGKRQCIRLLDDGSDKYPLERYNFGTGGKELLFKSCEVLDEDIAVMDEQNESSKEEKFETKTDILLPA